jgi:ligand-binding sensor domain-containing protein
MINHFIYLPLLCLLALSTLVTSCNGQVKTGLQNKGNIEEKKITSGHPKIIKTQGSNEYQNIYCSLQDKAGNIWFGTTGEGVYKYDGKVFTQFTIQNGLTSNTVWSILQDKEGNIWFGTTDGPCRYDGKSITPVPINGNLLPEINSDGYYNNWSTKKTVWSMLQDKSGRIWFGTGEGSIATMVDPLPVS